MIRGADHPWLRPLWRRLLVVAVTLGWGLFEALTGAVLWAVVFGGLGAMACWTLLLNYPPTGDK